MFLLYLLRAARIHNLHQEAEPSEDGRSSLPKRNTRVVMNQSRLLQLQTNETRFLSVENKGARSGIILIPFLTLPANCLINF